MTTGTSTLTQLIQQYVTALYQENPNPALLFHNLSHTRDVVEKVDQISRQYDLEEDEYFIVKAAAWFHDIGYVLGPARQHEEKSAEVAAEFLSMHQIPARLISQVQHCIMATRMPQSPRDKLAKILCDADLFHLGSEEFKEKSKLLRQEIETKTGRSIDAEEWRAENIRLLQTHRYFTEYGEKELAKGQKENLKRLLEKQAKKAAKKAHEVPVVDLTVQPVLAPQLLAQPEENGTLPKKKQKDDQPGRGVETMFRTTSTNHLHLSEMADSKANIMISVNSIIISVLISVAFRQLEENPYLIVPAGLFLATALTTIVLSIIATRPNVTRGTFTKEDISQKRANLLFFGNFHRMKLEDYEWGIRELMNDKEYLYGSMTRDIYYLGVVLGKKYKLLRMAYSVFMYGIILSILAFGITVLSR